MLLKFVDTPCFSSTASRETTAFRSLDDVFPALIEPSIMVDHLVNVLRALPSQTAAYRVSLLLKVFFIFIIWLEGGPYCQNSLFPKCRLFFDHWCQLNFSSKDLSLVEAPVEKITLLDVSSHCLCLRPPHLCSAWLRVFRDLSLSYL